MKNLISKEEKDQIDLICDQYSIKNYSINPDGSIDVDDSINLYNEKLDKLPLKFGAISGRFTCSFNNLTSLEGAPVSVDGDFIISHNILTSLEGAPVSVDGDFIISHNNLTSLEGCPHIVGGSFVCGFNRLTSLKGAPVSVGNNFHCYENQLISLDGSPAKIGGDFVCYDNKLTSTYSGDIDIEVSGHFSPGGTLPPLLKSNMDHNNVVIKLILKYQRYFEIWNDDLTLNEENFQVLISEIEDGLE